MSSSYSISEKELHKYLAIGTMIYEDEDRFAEACELYGPDIPLAFLMALLRRKHQKWEEVVNELQYSPTTSFLGFDSDYIYKLKTSCYLLERIGRLAFEPVCDSINKEVAIALFIGITRNGNSDWHETITIIRNSDIFRKVS